MFIFKFDRDQFLSEFGHRVKSLRESLYMTQEELATLSGYGSRSSIAKIEAGKTDVPRAKLAAIASALGVTSADLMPQPEVDQIDDEDIQLARKIRDLDPYRRALIESIINTDPEAKK